MRPISSIMLTSLTVLIYCCKNDKVDNEQDANQSKILNEKEKIQKVFKGWETREIKAGHFFASDSCNQEWFIDHKFDGTIDQEWGIPDSSEIKFSFADLNNDGKLDGLVTFTPDQCDGGNASMWTQLQLFLLSDKEDYKIIDTIQVDKFSSTEFDSLGFYWLDSIAANKIFGTYIEFKGNDGHCCPSINKPVTFDFVKRKLTFIGENPDKK